MMDSFTFFRSFRDAAMELPDKQRLAFYDALIGYGLDGIEPKISGAAKGYFLLVQPVIAKCKQKAEAGRKGGKQNGSKAEANAKQNGSKTEAKPKQTRSDKDIGIGEGEGIGEGIDLSKQERKTETEQENASARAYTRKSYDEVIGEDELGRVSPAYKEAVGEYIQMRQRRGNPLTNAMLESFLYEVDSLAYGDPVEKMGIVKQATLNGWTAPREWTG